MIINVLVLETCRRIGYSTLVAIVLHSLVTSCSGKFVMGFSGGSLSREGALCSAGDSADTTREFKQQI